MASKASKVTEPGNKVYEDYEQALFRVLMHEQAEQDGQELQATRERLKSLPEYQPSAEALATFTKQLDERLKQQRLTDRRKRISRVMNKVAVAVLAFFLVFSTAMNTVQAFRTKVMNLWLEVRPEFTLFRLQEDPDNQATNVPIVDWSNAYAPTYLPQGFTVKSSRETNAARDLVLERGDSIITFREAKAASSVAIDTEGAKVAEFEVNEQTATMAEKNGVIALVWEMDGRILLIRSNVDLEMVLKVARSVRFRK